MFLYILPIYVNRYGLSWEEALLAQRLVRLQHDIPLGFNLREIRYPPVPDAGA